MAESFVAVDAEQSSDLTRLVVVVNSQVLAGRARLFADRTAPVVIAEKLL